MGDAVAVCSKRSLVRQTRRSIQPQAFLPSRTRRRMTSPLSLLILAVCPSDEFCRGILWQRGAPRGSFALGNAVTNYPSLPAVNEQRKDDADGGKVGRVEKRTAATEMNPSRLRRRAPSTGGSRHGFEDCVSMD
jgi:hypothetical protein